MAVKLSVPISEDQIRALKVGDQVLLSGIIYTGRDTAHKYMIDNFIKGDCPDSEKAVYEELKKGLAGSVIYHCGPVARKMKLLVAGVVLVVILLVVAVFFLVGMFAGD